MSAAPVAVQPLPRGGLVAGVGRRARDWVPALVVLVAFVGLWQGIVKGRTCSASSSRRRPRSGRRSASNQGQLWHEGWFTFQEALGGFAIGCAAGIAARSRSSPAGISLGSALMPYAIAANAIPIIAFAPITNAWFNPLTKTSHMVIAAVLCFFPVFVNVVRGLRSVKPSQIELMRSYAVGELTVFRLVRVPTALPFLFTALRVASVLAMIGAIVSEYYGGRSTRSARTSSRTRRSSSSRRRGRRS